MTCARSIAYARSKISRSMACARNMARARSTSARSIARARNTACAMRVRVHKYIELLQEKGLYTLQKNLATQRRTNG